MTPAEDGRAATPARRFAPGLSHVVVVVNGERTAVEPDQTLNVYRGDNVTFIQAEARDAGTRISSLAIDVEGFASAAGNSQAGDDRGVDIATAALEGRAFPVKVRSGDRVVGQIKMVVAEPRFDYAVVVVNGQPVTVRQGGKVSLGPEDSVRVESVRTNIPDPTRVAVETSGNGLRFKYRGRVFGEIRMPVKAGDKKPEGAKIR